MIMNVLIFTCVRDPNLKMKPSMTDTENSKEKICFILYCHQNNLTGNLIKDSPMQQRNCWLKFRWMAVANVKIFSIISLKFKIQILQTFIVPGAIPHEAYKTVTLSQRG